MIPDVKLTPETQPSVINVSIECVNKIVKPEYYLSSNFLDQIKYATNWTAAHENTKLKLIHDDLYCLTLILKPSCNYQFKITNGTWDQSYGTEDNKNICFKVDSKHPERAVSFFFNTATKKASYKIW